jgi:23S rRNA (uracil1939-C5)-methyltransferase
MDPPRAGSTERFLLSLWELAPKRVVYISCNPETQARDLDYLCGRGYLVQKIQPVDMFPHTDHVETVVLMSRVKG